MKFASWILALATVVLATGCSTPPQPQARPLGPRTFWLDLILGEQVSDEDVFKDLATAGVAYVGESHTIARHHAVQLEVMQQLFARGVRLVLGMEQLEARDQPAVDRFNRRELDFDGLAEAIGWPKKWGNYHDYRALCEFAQRHGIPVHGLNAPADTIRAVNRSGGLARLAPELRGDLPAEIDTDDPPYERLNTLLLAVHIAVDPTKLRPMFEAQIARDEAMAENIVAARKRHDGPPRTVLVVLGAGHIRYGLGTAERVRRREPEIVERLVLVTDSGQLQLSAADRAASREIEIPHADVRSLGRPPADYLHVLPVPPAGALPAGHPPLGR